MFLKGNDEPLPHLHQNLMDSTKINLDFYLLNMKRQSTNWNMKVVSSLELDQYRQRLLSGRQLKRFWWTVFRNSGCQDLQLQDLIYQIYQSIHDQTPELFQSAVVIIIADFHCVLLKSFLWILDEISYILVNKFLLS